MIFLWEIWGRSRLPMLSCLWRVRIIWLCVAFRHLAECWTCFHNRFWLEPSFTLEKWIIWVWRWELGWVYCSQLLWIHFYTNLDVGLLGWGVCAWRKHWKERGWSWVERMVLIDLTYCYARLELGDAWEALLSLAEESWGQALLLW